MGIHSAMTAAQHTVKTSEKIEEDERLEGSRKEAHILYL
jgi:hypothetical protein